VVAAPISTGHLYRPVSASGRNYLRARIQLGSAARRQPGGGGTTLRRRRRDGRARGDDLFGPATLENLGPRIDTRYVGDAGRFERGVAPIFCGASGQTASGCEGANDRLTPADVDAAADVIRGPIPGAATRVRWNGLLRTPLRARLGVRTILNPAPVDARSGTDRGADYVIPNETEAEALTGMVEPRICRGKPDRRRLRL